MMDDYISRHAAIEECNNDYEHGYMYAYCLKQIPSADVVEVVRCWNCIWWDDCPSSTITPNFHKCKRVGQMSMPSDGFCSFGERKDDKH